MIDEDFLQKLRTRNAAILPQLDERQRRLFAASEARAAGHGGIAAVSRVTRIAASTIGRGLKELDAPPPPLKPGCVRRPGGGRKSLTETDPGLLDDLNALVEPDARGDPMSPLRWTCKSLRRLAAELDKLGHKISHTVVGELLKKQKFSLQANRKTREGADNPDRDAQFHVINDAVKAAMAENQPAISVDTKKKELVGDFKNAGREWRKQGDPEEVRVHDFLIKELGRAVPYGIYDLAANAGWVSVGIEQRHGGLRGSDDPPMVARRRPGSLSARAPPGHHRRRRRINGSRVRLWKLELQRLADELGISIEVHHLPPGTSKWNKIEHRLFSFITQNWRAKPLISYRVIVELIGATTTTNRLDRPMRTRRQILSQGDRRLGRGHAKPQYSARRFPRRMELHNRPINPHTSKRLIPDGPLAADAADASPCP